MTKKIERRDFLKLAGITLLSLAVEACVDKQYLPDSPSTTDPALDTAANTLEPSPTGQPKFEQPTITEIQRWNADPNFWLGPAGITALQTNPAEYVDYPRTADDFIMNNSCAPSVLTTILRWGMHALRRTYPADLTIGRVASLLTGQTFINKNGVPQEMFNGATSPFMDYEALAPGLQCIDTEGLLDVRELTPNPRLIYTRDGAKSLDWLRLSDWRLVHERVRREIMPYGGIALMHIADPGGGNVAHEVIVPAFSEKVEDPIMVLDTKYSYSSDGLLGRSGSTKWIEFTNMPPVGYIVGITPRHLHPSNEYSWLFQRPHARHDSRLSLEVA